MIAEMFQEPEVKSVMWADSSIFLHTNDHIPRKTKIEFKNALRKYVVDNDAGFVYSGTQGGQQHRVKLPVTLECIGLAIGMIPMELTMCWSGTGFSICIFLTLCRGFERC